MRSSGFWLVQRLSLAYEGNSKPGFDHYFALEYMGSAEYEFNAPSESLRAMRAKPLGIFMYTVGGRPVYFVCHPEMFAEKAERLDNWLADGTPSKEQSYFRENLTEQDWRGDPIDAYYKRTVAWWSYDENIAWTLDPDIAQTLLKAFGPKETT